MKANNKQMTYLINPMKRVHKIKNTKKSIFKLMNKLKMKANNKQMT